MRSWSRRRLLFGLSCASAAACGGTDRAAQRLPLSEPTTPRSRARAPRTPDQPLGPLGRLDDLAAEERRMFTDLEGFALLPPARADDWRSLRPELPQDVEAYMASRPNAPQSPRDRIALLPLGHFPFDVIEGPSVVGLVRTPELADIAAFVGAFFGLPTAVLPREGLEPDALGWREHRGQRQVDANTLMVQLAPRLPPDAYGMLALVNVDLFVWPEQEFGFGYSTFTDRLAVVGFSRFDPSFFGGMRPTDLWAAIVSRSLRVVVHEVAHLFGLAHCQYFCCVLNGIVDLEALDAVPLRLCPVCLRKLHRHAGIDPVARYAALLPLFERLGLADDAAWTRARLARLA